MPQQRKFVIGGPQPAARSATTAATRAPRRPSWTGSAAATAPAGVAGFHSAAPPPRAAKAPVLLPRVRLPELPPTPPEGYTGDAINDALDDLLRQAAASLKHLDGIRAKLPAAQRQGSTKDKRSDASNFWKPRCRADLWGDDDCWDDLSSNGDSDLESCDSAGVDVDEDGLWDFLRAACNSEPAGSANRATGRKAAEPPNRTFTEARRPQPAPKPTRVAGEAASQGEERSADGPAERARANGFRFGTYGASSSSSGRPPLPGSGYAAGAEVQGPEAQISAALNKAQAEGTDAVRATLKRLLLKWHPDKAPQGDGDAAVAARMEATRVLRFVLQERKRLGI